MGDLDGGMGNVLRQRRNLPLPFDDGTPPRAALFEEMGESGPSQGAGAEAAGMAAPGLDAIGRERASGAFEREKPLSADFKLLHNRRSFAGT
jgi:hypothetical protein